MWGRTCLRNSATWGQKGPGSLGVSVGGLSVSPSPSPSGHHPHKTQGSPLAAPPLAHQ